MPQVEREDADDQRRKDDQRVVAMRARNSLRMSCMPLMMRWPSATAGASDANESSSSTMSATARVACVPRLHRDAQIGFLQRQHVVHPVADHRDVVAAAAQRVHQPFLLLRRDASEDLPSTRGLGERVVVHPRQVYARDDFATRLRSPPVCERGHRLGVIAGDDLRRHPVGHEAFQRRPARRAAARPTGRAPRRASCPCGKPGVVAVVLEQGMDRGGGRTPAPASRCPSTRRRMGSAPVPAPPTGTAAASPAHPARRCHRTGPSNATALHLRGRRERHLRGDVDAFTRESRGQCLGGLVAWRRPTPASNQAWPAPARARPVLRGSRYP